MNGMANGNLVVDTKSALVREQVEKAMKMVEDVAAATDNVAMLYQDERETHQRWQVALANLEDSLNAAVADADFEASTEKTGPLAGIARTSDAYKVAVKKFRAELLAGSFRHEATVVNQFENDYREASIAYEQAKVRLGGLKTVSDLQVAILRALAG